ncbi:MAG: hypothetical protein LLG06_02215, partial [Desulfobacteraceae bacterium]|nr:hypothetical protein [Desulfobacteraceae bacterium]
NIPPLRQRADDVVLLAEYLIAGMNPELNRNVTRIPLEYIEAMKAYDWPGNIRELENVLRRSMILSRGEVLELDTRLLKSETTSTQQTAGAASDKLGSLEDIEREHILKTLRHTGGNFGEACKILGITRPTLRKKISDYGLKEFIEK